MLASSRLIMDRRIPSKMHGTFKPVSVDWEREQSGHLIWRSVSYTMLIGMQVSARDKWAKSYMFRILPFEG
jgi:hypothetical protein